MSRRLLYIHQYFVDPRSMPGGTRSYEIARRLVDEGIQITMLTADRSPDGTALRQENVEGINVIRIPCPYNNSFGALKKTFSFFRFSMLASWFVLHHKYDAIFATSTPLTVGIPTLIAHWFRRKPYVFEVRDLWPEMPIALGSIRNPILIWLLEKMESIIYCNADSLVGLSPGMSDGILNVLDQANVQKPIFTAPNACDFNLFAPKNIAEFETRREAMREKIGINPDQIALLYAGTFGILNDLDFACDLAAATLDRKDIVYVLVGTGIKEKSIVDRIAKEKLANMRLPGRQSKDDMADVFAAADIGLSLFVDVPAMEKNSANKFFDALAAGKPVILNYGGWQADFIHETGVGKQLPRDIEAATSALANFIAADYPKINSDKVIDAAQVFSRDRIYGEVRKAINYVIPTDSDMGAQG